MGFSWDEIIKHYNSGKTLHTHMTVVSDTSSVQYIKEMERLLKEGHDILCTSCDRGVFRSVLLKREMV